MTETTIEKTPIPADELTHRSIDKIETSGELFGVFRRVIQSLPATSTYAQCVDEFRSAWKSARIEAKKC